MSNGGIFEITGTRGTGVGTCRAEPVLAGFKLNLAHHSVTATNIWFHFFPNFAMPASSIVASI